MSGAVQDAVKEYYGKVLSASGDLATNACTTGARPPAHVLSALKNVHEDVCNRYYGCGLVLPDELAGRRVLDLGCGSGRDVYLLAQFVGESGSVVGVDMTDEQLSVAAGTLEWHRARFGYAKGNVEFKKGYIERLGELGLADGSFDVVVSNCVINLSPDKEAVLGEVFRILKPGGELYFSDVYADRRIPKALRDDPVLWGECLSGALYINDFFALAKQVGFKDPRVCKESAITVGNKKLEALVGHIKFKSTTFRLFKLAQLEPECEDYGLAVRYKGTLPNCPREWELDQGHALVKGRITEVCGNTWFMLKATRFEKHFDFFGELGEHFGVFPGCGGKPFLPPQMGAGADGTGACGPGGSCC
jgi:SAM-dependent methyltransferase